MFILFCLVKYMFRNNKFDDQADERLSVEVWQGEILFS